jgi:hypothetical protein
MAMCQNDSTWLRVLVSVPKFLLLVPRSDEVALDVIHAAGWLNAYCARRPAAQGSRKEVRNVHRHLVDLGGVVQLDIAQDADVLAGDEVDGNTLAPKASRATNAVNVVFSVRGQVIVDD